MNQYQLLSIVTTLTLAASLASTLAYASDALPVKAMLLKTTDHYQQQQIFTGVVESDQTSPLSFEIAGQVQSLAVDEGDEVEIDQPLVTLNTRRLRAAFDEANAALDEARATLKLRQTTYQRFEKLAAANAVSAQELDVAEENQGRAQAAVNRQRAALQRIQVDLDKSVLSAPFDGVITQRLVDEGQVVNSGETVLVLQTRALQARIAFPMNRFDEQTFDLIRGQAVMLKKPHNTPIPAVVKAVLPIRNPRTQTVDVLFKLLQAQLQAGDLIQYANERQIADQGHWVPLSALTETIRGLWGVYVINDNTVERHVVEVLSFDQQRAFVRGLTTENELVIVADGIQRLVPGQRVLPLFDEAE